MADSFQDGRDDLPIFIHSELDDLGLGLGAFRVYCHLVRRCGKNGRAWPSYGTMAELCFRRDYPTSSLPTLRRRAMEAIAELRAHGLITVEHRKDTQRGNKSNVYRLTPRREWTPPSANALAPLCNSTTLVHMHPPSANAPEGTKREGSPSEGNNPSQERKAISVGRGKNAAATIHAGMQFIDGGDE